LRVDKFLKVSRIIKRRTVANEFCEQERVKINGRTAKPGSEVNAGDVLEIQFGSGTTTVEVLTVSEHVTKEGSKEMYVIK